MNNKVFSQGTGRLTADVLNTWQATTNTVDNMAPANQPNGWQGPKLLRVIGSTEMTRRGDVINPGDPEADPPVPPTYADDIEVPNRWWYDVEEISMKNSADSSSWKVRSPREMVAINLAEAANTETEAMGIVLADLPDGFELQHIPDGSIVHGFTCSSPFERGASSPEFKGYVLAFTLANQFDGSC